STLTISNVQTTDAGVYVVQVSLAPGDMDTSLFSDGGLTVLSPYDNSALTNGLYDGVASGYSGAKAGASLADSLFSRIAFLDSSNNLTTILGSVGGFGYADGTNGSAKLATPQGIAVDANTNLYIADTGNHLIRLGMPAGTNWVLTTIAGHYQTNGGGLPIGGYGDGIGTNAYFSHPYCIAVDSFTNIYVGDGDSNVVRKIVLTNGNWLVST